MITKDRSLAVVILLMVAILLVESGNIPDKTSWQPYGSALFPRLLLFVIGLLATVVLIKSLLSPAAQSRPRVSLVDTLYKKRKIIALFILFGLYALALPHVGYLIATIGFMLTAQILLMGFDTRKKALIILGTSFTLVPMIYAIFQHGLNIWLP